MKTACWLVILVGVTFSLSVHSATFGERYAAGSPKRYKLERPARREFVVPEAASSNQQEDTRIHKRSAAEDALQFSPDEFRTEIIQPIMNIMGLGLSVFGNMYPVRQLRNDDGSPMNTTQLKSFRTDMNAFHAKFAELGQHLTGVVEHSRALKPPFQLLGKKISLSRQLQMQNRKLKIPPT